MKFSRLDEHRESEVIEAAVVIVGAGPAGITIARSLAKRRISVCLVESGDLHTSTAAQDLNRGENIGRKYWQPERLRIRAFGGSSAHWGGFCGRFSPLDFAKRSWIPNSGWPIPYEDLTRYYPEAESLLQLEPAPGADELKERFELAPDRLAHRLIRYSPPTRFGETYRSDLEQSAFVRVVLDATVTDFIVKPSGLVAEVKGISQSGKTIRIRGRHFILAAGALENTRLLMGGRGLDAFRDPKKTPALGRYFMEHPEALSGLMIFSGGQGYPQTYRTRVQKGVSHTSVVTLSDQAQARERLAGVDMYFMNLASKASSRPNSIENDNVWTSLLHALPDLDRKKSRESQNWTSNNWPVFTLWNAMEQVPNQDSRIVLGEDLDAHGLRRLQIDWRITAQEVQSLRRAHQLMACEMGRLRIGRVRVTAGEDLGWQVGKGGWHQIGTVRMGESGETSVVDPNCKIRGSENLFVAGSAVFPTSSTVPPTLTIVALSLRLADHLATKIERV